MFKNFFFHKTPNFWTNRNFLSYLLLPLSFLYYIGFFIIKKISKPKKVNIPIICIGNLIAGGSGKTPTAIAIGKILQQNNINFAFLTRGFGSKNNKDIVKITKNEDIKKYSFDKYGDEPLLLKDYADTYISKNRFLASKEIEKNKNYQTIILDDGFQNNSIKKDFSILVIDSNICFGNQFLIPAGPLREPINNGLNKADLIIIIGKKNLVLEHKIKENSFNKTLIYASIKANNLNDFYNKKIVAFCGLAYPKKFFSFLLKEKLNIIATFDFPDHYQYSNNDIERLLKISKDKDAVLLTTKKDWVKLNNDYQKQIKYLDIFLEISDQDLLIDKLKGIL